jgi:hypothetical protein
MELAQELLELIVRTSAGGMAAVSRGRANSLKAIRPTGTRSLVRICRDQTPGPCAGGRGV